MSTATAALNIVVALKGNADRDLATASKAARDLGKESGGAVGHVTKLGTSIAALGRFTPSITGVGRAIAGMGQVAAAGAVGAVAALGVGLGVAGKAGLGFNNEMEQARAAINAFTKDGAATEALLEQVEARAKSTPFAFNEMASAAAGLQPVMRASGESFEALISKAEILAASNPAEGLTGAVFALKEAAGGDFASIIERFNLPRGYINQLKAEGVPNLQIVSMAMQQLGLDTDLVTSMANTASGRWSTFTDTLKGMASIVTQPLFDAFSGGLGTVNGLLDANAPKLEAFAHGLGERISGAITWLSTTGLPGLITGWQLLSPAVSGVLTWLGEAGAWIGERLPSAISIAQGFFNGVLVPAWNAVAGVVTGVVVPALSTAYTWLQDNLPTAITTAQTFFDTTLRPALDGVAGFVMGTVVPAFSTAYTWLQTNLPTAITTAQTFFDTTLKPALEGASTFVTGTVVPALTSVRDWLETNIPKGISAAQEMFDTTLKPAFERASSFVTGTVVPALTAARNWLLVYLPAAIDDLKKSIDTTYIPGMQGLKAITETVTGTTLPNLKTGFGDTRVAAVDVALNGIVALATEFSELKAVYDATIKPALETLKTLFTDLLEPVRGVMAVLGLFRKDSEDTQVSLDTKLAVSLRVVSGLFLNDLKKAADTAKLAMLLFKSIGDDVKSALDFATNAVNVFVTAASKINLGFLSDLARLVGIISSFRPPDTSGGGSTGGGGGLVRADSFGISSALAADMVSMAAGQVGLPHILWPSPPSGGGGSHSGPGTGPGGPGDNTRPRERARERSRQPLPRPDGSGGSGGSRPILPILDLPDWVRQLAPEDLAWRVDALRSRASFDNPLGYSGDAPPVWLDALAEKIGQMRPNMVANIYKQANDDTDELNDLRLFWLTYGVR